MFNPRLVGNLLLAMFCSSPLLAQSPSILPSSLILANQLKASFLLLESYQSRFVLSELSRREFEYAQLYLCPQFPTPGEMHICNSSVVGTSGESPEEIIPFHSDVIVKVNCIKCIFVAP